MNNTQKNEAQELLQKAARNPADEHDEGKSQTELDARADSQARWEELVIFFWNAPEYLRSEFRQTPLYEKLSLILVTAGLATAVYAGTIYKQQLNAMQNQIAEMQRGTNASQRAYVGVHGLEIQEAPQNDGPLAGLIVSPVFSNAGNTPAKNLRWTSTSRDWDPYLPFSDKKRGSPGEMEDLRHVSLNPMSIGPRQEIRNHFSNGELIQRPFVDAIRKGQLTVYIHGAVVYQDAFSDDYHVTRYCYFLWGNNAVVASPFGVAYSHCGDGRNCTDEECGEETKRQLAQRLASDARERLRREGN